MSRKEEPFDKIPVSLRRLRMPADCKVVLAYLQSVQRIASKKQGSGAYIKVAYATIDQECGISRDRAIDVVKFLLGENPEGRVWLRKFPKYTNPRRGKNGRGRPLANEFFVFNEPIEVGLVREPTVFR